MGARGYRVGARGYRVGQRGYRLGARGYRVGAGQGCRRGCRWVVPALAGRGCRRGVRWVVPYPYAGLAHAEAAGRRGPWYPYQCPTLDFG